MRVAVVGGGLQGTEAAYLAGKAGWEVRLVDRRPAVPASGLADSFIQADACDERELDAALAGADIVLPALEDARALETLTRWAARRAVPLAFDLAAYAVSSSKRASNSLFERQGFAVPKAWPGCPFPVLAKPDGLSGSRGVRVFADEKALVSWLEGPDGQERPCADGSWVIQEFLAGPSYSIEVLGSPGAHRALQVTDLAMDAGYDCKRVEAPSLLPEQLAAELGRTVLSLAEALHLRGLMDLEAILHDGRLWLLEIDARLPSQTPIAVFWSTGYNMVRALGGLFLAGEGGKAGTLPPPDRWRSVLLEHVHAHAGCLEVGGEHMMARRVPLRVRRDFFGADEAITDYYPGNPDWVATLILTGADRAEARRRRDEAVAAIARICGLSGFLDSEPAL